MEIIGLLITVVRVVVITQFVLYLLIVFNVLSIHNRYVGAIWEALGSILAPMLDPIRRRLPPVGGIDFSYMVLLFGLIVVEWMLGSLYLLSAQ